MTFWKALFIGVTLFVVVSVRDLVFGQGGTWVARAPIPTPRGRLGVGVVNGILYAVGGSIVHTGVGGYAELLSTVEAYSPSTNSWSSKAPLPTPRSGVAVGVVDGILYALGGSSSQTKPTLDTMDAYDPVRNAWTARAPMPTPRSGFALGVTRGTLYAVGGWATNNGPTGLVEAYDPITNKWTIKAPLPSPRVALSVGVVNGILYAVGGACCSPGHGSRIFGTVEAYDPATNTWTTKAPMPTPRYYLAVAVVNLTLNAVGGHKGSGGNAPTTNETAYATTAGVVEAYDPSRNVWTAKAPLPGNTNFVSLGSVNGILYAVGGAKWVPAGADSYPPCGSSPACVKIAEDPITYAFEAVP
jgi:hypothetical protein